MKVGLLAPVLLAGSLAAQDVPARVGRLSFLFGPVSYRPGHTENWGDAVLNLPLSDGDHLWTDLNAQAEVRAGAASAHLAPQTGFSIVKLDDRVVRVALSEGAANLRIARLNEDETVEVMTPAGTFRLLRPGSYRIDVVPAGNYVSLAVRSGAAEATAGPQTVSVSAGQRLVLAGNPAALEFLDLPPMDAWDEWCAERDAVAERAIEASEEYVDWELPGVEELASNGDWSTDAEYGSCWVPANVSSDWTPFRFGRWVFKLPWGWTWVDGASWGFTPSHFGRWARIKHGWGWIPGHRHRKEPYSPATVAFAPGAGRVAWMPLAPGESPTAARRNREAANSAEVATFRTSRPLGPGRLPDTTVAFTARTPEVEPAPEAVFAGHMHPVKPEAEARAHAPIPVLRVEPAHRVAEEDNRAPAPASYVEPAPAPPPPPPPVAVHVEETPSRHSDPPPESRRVDDSPPSPPPQHHSSPPVQHSSPAPAPPAPAPSAPSHSTVQEHRAETPRPAMGSRK